MKQDYPIPLYRCPEKSITIVGAGNLKVPCSGCGQPMPDSNDAQANEYAKQLGYEFGKLLWGSAHGCFYAGLCQFIQEKKAGR